MGKFLLGFLRAVMPRRRGLQFSLAGVLALFAVCAVVLRIVSSAAQSQKMAVDGVKSDRGAVRYDYELDAAGGVIPDPVKRWPDWLEKRLGIDYLADVAAVEFREPRLNARGLKSLAELPDLKRVDIVMCRLVDDQLSHLASLEKLERVVFDKTWVQGAGLANLAASTGLKSLSLSDCPLDDEAFANIARFSQLEELNLHNTPITAGRIERLAGLTQLKRLDLSSTAVDDAALASLASLHKLEALSLDATRVAGPGIAALAFLPNLATLDLGHSLLEDSALANVAQCESLVDLDLEGNYVSIDGLAQLARLARLQTLAADVYDETIHESDFVAKLREKIGVLADAAKVSDAERTAMIDRASELTSGAWRGNAGPQFQRYEPRHIQDLYQRFVGASADEQWAAAEFLALLAASLEELEQLGAWQAKVRSDELFALAVRGADSPGRVFSRWAESKPRLLAIDAARETLAKLGKSIDPAMTKLFAADTPIELACRQASVEGDATAGALYLFDSTEGRSDLRKQIASQWRQSEPQNAAAWLLAPLGTLNLITGDEASLMMQGAAADKTYLKFPRMPRPSHRARGALAEACQQFNIPYRDLSEWQGAQSPTAFSPRDAFETLLHVTLNLSAFFGHRSRPSIEMARNVGRKLLLTEPRELVAVECGVYVYKLAANNRLAAGDLIEARRAAVEQHAIAAFESRFRRNAMEYRRAPPEVRDELLAGIAASKHPLAESINADIAAWQKLSERIAAASAEELTVIAVELCEGRW